MRENETELEMVRRHVETGAGHIARQRALITRLRRRQLSTEQAEALLVTFEAMQHQHEDHLMRLIDRGSQIIPTDAMNDLAEGVSGKVVGL